MDYDMHRDELLTAFMNEESVGSDEETDLVLERVNANAFAEGAPWAVRKQEDGRWHMNPDLRRLLAETPLAWYYLVRDV